MNKYSLFFTSLLISITACSEVNKVEKLNYPIEKIVQAIIDHKDLRKYFYSEKIGRVPLLISGQEVDSEFKVKKFRKKVLVSKDKNIKGAHLKFTVFECKFNNYCNVVFKYEPEGITGSTGVVINPDGSIHLEKTDISRK